MKPIDHEDETELAYFTNSYPVGNQQTAAYQNNLSNISAVVACIETLSFVYVGYKAFTFSSS